MAKDADKISAAAARAARIKDVERMASQGKIGIREAMELVKKIDPSLYPDPKKKKVGGAIMKNRGGMFKGSY